MGTLIKLINTKPSFIIFSYILPDQASMHPRLSHGYCTLDIHRAAIGALSIRHMFTSMWFELPRVLS